MTARLHHRGPDGRGVYSAESGALGLAHTRLKVIDLETGDQPMFCPRGRLVVVFNGEIYNFRELRAELAKLGHAFRTRSDTEVILAAYAEWGRDCVGRFEGMFAFALWDSKSRRLLLARDRAGKKPLFVYRDAKRVVFASELKAILAHPEVPAEIDPPALPLYLTYGYVPSPGTFYRGIRKLPPGTTVEVGLQGEWEERTYWEPSFDWPPLRIDRKEAARELRRLLVQAIRRRLIADVPLGAFLSGGIDSTIIVGLMTQLLDQPVRTFSIGFAGDPYFDETAIARETSRVFGTNHTEFVVEPQEVNLLDSLVEAYDEPFGDSSAIPTSIVAKLTRAEVTVALTGDGGDELFAGYYRLLAGSYAEALPVLARRLGAQLAGLLPSGNHPRDLRTRTRRFLRVAAEPLPERYLHWIGFFPDQVPDLLRPELRNALFDREATLASFTAILSADRGGSTLGRLLALNYRTYLLDDLLVKADRCSMMRSLEVRAPFLDTDLVQFASRLPDRLRARGRRTKYLLRHAFADLLPAHVLGRGKMGFGIPLDRWFRSSWRSTLEERLLQREARVYEWLEFEAVRRMIEEHQAGRSDRGHQLWALLTLASWMESGAAAGAAPDPAGSDPRERKYPTLSAAG